MLLAAAAVSVFSLEAVGVSVVGPVAGALHAPVVPSLGLSEWAELVLPAAGIVLVGYSDNMLTARSFAARSGGSVDGNTELVALGAANVAAGAGAGVPGEQQREPHLGG